ncbi:glycoside hydrolase family 28 protein [Reichenbachiella ulvae]|uniref:Glycoside hydrolase family 28 protein n=1 Tax=Reichenbachiella ulvae TaxID=2980104 RepID=A0ABT3CYR0_9BACT|nr:glycoside hydrolase family 28 protein [Reichenbachiella ulvae]MCV9388836.1 glycoside hydrolase family 28 protein [Reichenbachiella ulvae]
MKLKKNRILLAALALSMAGVACQPTQQQSAPTELAQTSEMDALYEGLEFDMPRVQEASFPDYKVSIADFGAIGDGLVDNSEAIAKAIDDVASNGGGTVVIPRGLWLTGPITMKSNINLHAAAGALVLFSTDKSVYPLIETSFEGLDTYRLTSPINGKGLENIAITGTGTFDGNGQVWRAVKKGKMSPSQWSKLLKSGGVLSDNGNTWYPSQAYKDANALTKNFNVAPFETREEFEAIRDFLRPVMLSLVECNKVLLDGPTFQNSPAWNLHPLMCENVILRNLNIRNPWYSQNGDGLDLESCKNALVYNNTFDVGDDAICFKSGKDEDGRKRGMPTENVIVKNNVVYHGHGGFVVGSEMSGGMNNVHVSNCTFIGTDTGLRFKSTRGRGGVVENIYISNIDMINIPTEAIRFNLFYGGQSPVLEEGQEDKMGTKAEPVPVTEETPSFRNIHMKNITSTGSKAAAFFMGLPEMKLQNVTLENAMLDAEKGITMVDVDGITLKNVKLVNRKGTSVVIYNGANVDIDAQIESAGNEPIVKVLGAETKAVSLKTNLEEGQVSVSESLKAEVTFQ